MMMKILAAIFTLIALQTQAQAEGNSLLPSVSEHGFAGYYGGVSFGENSGFWRFAGGGPCVTCFDIEGELTQIYFGRNYEINSFLYGAEAALSIAGSAYQAEIASTTTYPQYAYTTILDMKARAGFENGNFMAYGFVGYSISVADFQFPSEGLYHGYNYGAGIETMINDRYTIGVEYIDRRLDNEPSGFSNLSGNVETLSLRVGMNF